MAFRPFRSCPDCSHKHRERLRSAPRWRKAKSAAWRGKQAGTGADTVAYWQWHSALNGQEQYHGVIVGADGTPVPIYSEIRQIGQEFTKLAPILQGTSLVSDVALLLSYDSRCAIDFQPPNRNYDQLKVLL